MKIIEKENEKLIEPQKIDDNFIKVYNIFQNIKKEQKDTSIPNKELIFKKNLMACFFQGKAFSSNEITDVKKFIENINRHKIYGKYEIDWAIPTLEEYRKIRLHLKGKSDNSIYYYCLRNNNLRFYRRATNTSSVEGGYNFLVPIYRIGTKGNYINNYSVLEILSIFLEKDLIPQEIYDEKLEKSYERIKKDYKKIKGVKKDEDSNIWIIYFLNGDREERRYINGKLEKISTYYFSTGKEEKILNINRERKKITRMYNLLNVDKIRMNLDSYNRERLLDPNMGHWDLYNNEKETEEIKNELKENVYARNPVEDIEDEGIIGIDFGTKSTVVVFQNDTKILPMRISGTKFDKKIEESDYENPTVIEFKNIENFMKDYNEKLGRPLTKWEDITVSHTAFQNLVNGGSSQFNSIISDLKQWSACENEKILIKDKKGTEKIFESYLDLKEEDIDPIEIYAYYIGSYINNMNNNGGAIYLEYFLSFPVTYKLEIRNKILKSFERGIKKSLPISILENEEVMKKFSVNHGSNEPAAYAVTALEKYELEPKSENEKIYYGVFDFGGGTTDFDFGIWQYSEDERSFDYELEHFGAGGDRYLGGENILKELSFQVFKENQDELRSNRIVFSRPREEFRFLGDEILVDKSREARLNIKKFMEKLRGIWENNGDEITEKIKVNLYSKDGELVSGIELNIDIGEIKKIIEKKISNGINNFFVSMREAFKNETCDKINIFLAGNSCKHPFVMEKFKEYILESGKQEKKIELELFPALGTSEAFEKMKERNIKYNENDMTAPTGKTGVAYGLVESRPGGRIKIINRDEKKDKEAKFRYFIGYQSRRKLKVILNPNNGYNNWQYLLNVTANKQDFYYSTLPEAINDTLPIEGAKRKRITLKKNYGSDYKVYIQAIGVNKIKYVVTNEEIENKNFIEEMEINLD